MRRTWLQHSSFPISIFSFPFSSSKVQLQPNPSRRTTGFESVFVLALCMSFRRTSLRFTPNAFGEGLTPNDSGEGRALATQLSSVCFPQAPNGERSTSGNAGKSLSPLFSYSCKRLPPQPLSLDTQTNSPAVAYPLLVVFARSFALLPKSKKRISLRFNRLRTLCQKHRGVP